MNMLHLRYAVEVARTGSITQAAENLYMGQPNLSKAIKELEESIGILLFKRSTKGVVPTKQGAEFLQYARNILSQIEEMEKHYRPDGRDRQRFSICVPRGSYISYAFSQYIAGLDMEKGIDANFSETNSMQAIAHVSSGEFHLGIIRYQTIYESYFLNFLQEKQLHHQPVWEFEYVALMSKAHPLAMETQVSYDALCEYIEITHGDISVPYLPHGKAQQEASSPHARKRIYVYERGSQYDLLTNVAGTYMWVSPVPNAYLERYGLVQRKCSVMDHTCKDLLVTPKDYQFNQQEDAFLERLYAVRDELKSGSYH